MQATKKGLVYEVAILDARDTLEVHAFAIKRSFLVLLDYETREPMETEYIFRKPAPRILVISDPANPNAPTCRLSSKVGFAEFHPMH